MIHLIYPYENMKHFIVWLLILECHFELVKYTLKRQVQLLRNIGFRCWSDKAEALLKNIPPLSFLQYLGNPVLVVSNSRLFVSTCVVRWCLSSAFR